jgi:WD40 repeat protein
MHEVSNAKQIWQLDNIHKGGVTSLELTEDSKFISTGGADGVVRLWEIRSLAMKTNLKEHTNKITKVKLWPGDDKLISSSRDKSLLFWDLNKEKRLQAFYQTMGGVNSFDIIPEHNLIVSTGQDRKISYWDLRTPNVVKCFDTDLDAKSLEECTRIRCSKDGKRFYTGGQYVKAWDFASGKIMTQHLGHSNGVSTLDLSADQTTLLTGGYDASIILWNIS